MPRLAIEHRESLPTGTPYFRLQLRLVMEFLVYCKKTHKYLATYSNPITIANIDHDRVYLVENIEAEYTPSKTTKNNYCRKDRFELNNRSRATKPLQPYSSSSAIPMALAIFSSF